MKRNGFRKCTRKKFKKDLRKHGMPNTSTYLQVYKIGDYVDIKVDSAVNKDMPHKIYHGRTGRVYKVDERTVGVKVKRIVGNSQIEERLNIRIEHLSKSKCRDDFLKRVAEYKKMKQEALEKGEAIPSPKRVMKGGRSEFTISLKNNEPVVVGFEKHCDVF